VKPLPHHRVVVGDQDAYCHRSDFRN
jgi:hypothetical protein